MIIPHIEVGDLQVMAKVQEVGQQVVFKINSLQVSQGRKEGELRQAVAVQSEAAQASQAAEHRIIRNRGIEAQIQRREIDQALQGREVGDGIGEEAKRAEVG